jgi:LemA protein
MVGAFVIAGVIALVIVVALLLIYNRFVRLRNLVRESWRDIDTELQRRYDLIPNLVETVKGYTTHEREVMDTVTSLRIDAMAIHRPADAQGEHEQALGRSIGRLVAVAEKYPDLKASDQYLALQRELVATEDRIQVARRVYNANVRSYDSLVQSFPSMIIAKLFEFAAEPYFELEPAVSQAGPPSVDLSPGT